MVKVAGLDLSASTRRYTGLAVIDDNTLLFIGRVKYDQEILDTVTSYKPRIVAIDSPLSHAEGFREVDLVMKRRGFPVLPPGWRSMRMLVDRALKLKSLFEEQGLLVVETHPRSALKSSGCRDYDELLNAHGIKVGYSLSRDEYDAIVAALVARYYSEDRALKIEASDGVIYLLPRICV